MTVPITIATVRILTVMAGGQYYGIPTTIIDQIGRVQQEDLRDLEGSPVVLLGKEPIRWVQLSELLGMQKATQMRPQAVWPYVLVHQPEGRIALAVEELEDETEVLLKPLGFPLRGLAGVVARRLG